MPRDPVELHNVVCKVETERAILCVIGDDEHWIPKSQIEPDSEVQGLKDEGTLVISAWIAREKNLD